VLALARIADAVVLARPVADRLAVRADGRHAVGIRAGREQRFHAIGVDARQAVGGQRFAMDLVVAGLLQAPNASRSASGTVWAAASTAGCAPEKSTSTPSAPSMEVPDIRPINSLAGLWGGRHGQLLAVRTL
jgi:hypothetical protein